MIRNFYFLVGWAAIGFGLAGVRAAGDGVVSAPRRFPAARPPLAAGKAPVAKSPAYRIESVTVLVDIEDRTQLTRSERVTTTRYVYGLRLLRDVELAEGAFQEALHNHFGRELRYWPGSAPQKLHAQRTNVVSFEVALEGRKGELKTLVTGMTVVDDLPLSVRKLRGFNFQPNEFVAVYPNEEDEIGVLTFLVTSRTTDLQIEPQPAWRRSKAGQEPRFSGAQRFPRQPGVSDSVTLSTEFRDLKPGEVVGLKYRW